MSKSAAARKALQRRLLDAGIDPKISDDVLDEMVCQIKRRTASVWLAHLEEYEIDQEYERSIIKAEMICPHLTKAQRSASGEVQVPEQPCEYVLAPIRDTGYGACPRHGRVEL